MVGKGPWLSLTCLRHHRLKQYNDIPMGGIEPLHIPVSLDLELSLNPSWNRGGPLASKGHARKVMPPPTESFVSESGPPKNNLFWRNRAFFPVASRSNPRCSKVQIASYWAQIGRFLALAPQRMSRLFGKDRVFFGDNVNVFNFWISLKKPVIIISYGLRIVGITGLHPNLVRITHC